MKEYNLRVTFEGTPAYTVSTYFYSDEELQLDSEIVKEKISETQKYSSKQIKETKLDEVLKKAKESNVRI